jgi:hypothetical protein
VTIIANYSQKSIALYLFSGFGIIYIFINRIIERGDSLIQMETSEKPFAELAVCGNFV